MTTDVGRKIVRFEMTACPLRKLVRSAGDAALDAAAILREGSFAAGRRAEDVLSRLRLDREIRDLRDEINLQMRAVGEMIYASHKGSPSDSGKVQKILEYIDGLHEELDAHRREQDTLRGLLICPACGEANRSNCLYCQNCGKPLSRG